MRSVRTVRRCVTVAPQFHREPARRSHHTSESGSNRKPLHSILIANRGEIALRVSRTARKFGIRTTTIYTNPDIFSQHAHASPWSFYLGSTEAYLDQDKILDIAKQQQCSAIHPGYGFLSENAEFARKCADAGIKFIGPPASAIDDMGDKARSKEIMTAAGVPCVPGYHGSDQSQGLLAEEAERIGYPVLIKAVRGGGGKGMRIVQSATEFAEMLASAQSEARSSFGNDEVLLEKYITTPRHIEVQVFADQHGNCLALGERDCSIQRRHQKILEESPAPNLDDTIRKDLWGKARAAALAVGYEGAGTVEFIFDNDTDKFYFMEMNTRLQVEHPVTEMVTGLDLVHWQILVAEGQRLPLTQEQVERRILDRGHAIEARIYAENPDKGFVPDSGTLLHVQLPLLNDDVRIDSGFIEGDDVSSHYDPMIAKLIVRGSDREDALRKMTVALDEYEVAGPITNIDFLKRVCKSADFRAGHIETGYIQKHRKELFSQPVVTQEVLVEAGLAMILSQSNTTQSGLSPPDRASSNTVSPSWLQTHTSFRPRRFEFTSAAEEAETESAPRTYSVTVQQTSPSTFSVIENDGDTAYTVRAHYHISTRTMVTYFPHTRHTSRVIIPPANALVSGVAQPIHLFTPQGSFRLLVSSPEWFIRLTGATEKTNSLLSPMPCKILKVHVLPGDTVKKDQPLLVIESMKMETTIRAPGDDMKVRRVMHMEGEVVGSGVELVEFVQDN